MNDDETEIDPGAPVAELRSLRHAVDPRFRDRLHGKLQRKFLGRQVVELAWFAPFLVLLEFIGAIFGLLGVGDGEKPRRE